MNIAKEDFLEFHLCFQFLLQDLFTLFLHFLKPCLDYFYMQFQHPLGLTCSAIPLTASSFWQEIWAMQVFHGWESNFHFCQTIRPSISLVRPFAFFSNSICFSALYLGYRKKANIDWVLDAVDCRMKSLRSRSHSPSSVAISWENSSCLAT